ncbi:TIGR03084 family metal-binding protein [Kribbella sp. NPDC056861]|uniref:TIGR03084 family metal-binding protein n=1 Tax=Kribbella sp. NPDC056861 TaxID=3154857 RepID=UPI00341C89A0
MIRLAEVLADLVAEGNELDDLVSGLPQTSWRLSTPAGGWTIADQIAHLAWTDSIARMSIDSPAEFASIADRARGGLAAYVDRCAAETAKLAPGELLSYWRCVRSELVDVLAAAPASELVAWFGPPLSLTWLATARIMETWAHGQDVLDAVGRRREPTARLRHVAQLGVRARDYAFTVNGLTAPVEEFRTELTAPDGQLWTWGPEDAAQRVIGSAHDFCLRVTQRRHLADLDLHAVGTDAEVWLMIAQAYAGQPGTGRRAGQFDDLSV